MFSIILRVEEVSYAGGVENLEIMLTGAQKKLLFLRHLHPASS